ncbi:hypothetical protein [Silvibacterium acidisoli]|uniref:hypothetical protein n=1 Tax=Acidobacteriaceae bacterium ZG23-2 TaxID=2883246 RepID=UPI00406CCB21
MKPGKVASTALLAILASVVPSVFAQGTDGVPARAIVTVMGKKSDAPPATPQQKDFKVSVDGKNANITGLSPLRDDRSALELVILIDGGARESLGRQLNDIADFVKGLPPATAVGIAYMENGRAVFAQPFSTDKNQALKSLHLPAGVPGINASPYFCLSDLAKSWPSQNPTARREVVMVTDGVDNYDRRFDPDDPYVQAAITDSVRAGLVVYTIYWHDQGRFQRGLYNTNAGQSLMLEVTQATGGNSYWQGLGNPVSFSPFFDDLGKRLQNQYELGFTTPAKKKPEVSVLKIKLNMPDVKMDSPQRVLVAPAGASQN